MDEYLDFLKKFKVEYDYFSGSYKDMVRAYGTHSKVGCFCNGLKPIVTKCFGLTAL
jgi:hypothetical protein